MPQVIEVSEFYMILESKRSDLQHLEADIQIYYDIDENKEFVRT